MPRLSITPLLPYYCSGYRWRRPIDKTLPWYIGATFRKRPQMSIWFYHEFYGQIMDVNQETRIKRQD